MARVKRGTMRHKRHKKVIQRATGYWGRKKNVFSRAHEQVMKSGQYAFRDRRAKKPSAATTRRSPQGSRHAGRGAPVAKAAPSRSKPCMTVR